MRKASSMPSFSAVPERSFMVMGVAWGAWKRHSWDGRREIMRVEETLSGCGSQWFV